MNQMNNELNEKEWLEELIQVVPSDRQLNWQSLEFTAFFHYGINSFTDREWGDGKEDISIFHPQNLDTDQWCESLVLAGMKACIITAKHHDGFCLWNTKYTDHSVMYTPLKRDIVKELSLSCKKYGLKLGIYLSPWDRHEKTYGMGRIYDDYFCNQLTELLTNYGDVYTVWFDGACGEGENGKRQVYDWERYYELIRRLQPGAVISVCGPDVRWCGNEAGDCRESEWSVVDAELFNLIKIQKSSQTVDDTSFRELTLSERDRDLGSREVLKRAKQFIWYPAEVNTSIRPGWFYHTKEDDKVRSFSELKNIYLKSVGGNALFLLNIPPHYDGYITEYDRIRLRELGDFIRDSFCDDIAKQGVITHYKKEDDSECEKIQITWDKEQQLKYIVIKENITLGQRVENFVIRGKKDNGWTEITSGTTVGYKKICEVDFNTSEIQVIFTQTRGSIQLEDIEVYV